MAERRRRSGRIAAILALGLLLLLVIGLATLWIARRPLASNFLGRELERRGVQASYRLDRVGLRTQQVSNLVLGDPRNPDLTAKFAQIQVRIQWTGQVEVYRIVARGVRLRGRFVRGRVSWGQIDRLLPPPSGKPFQLPDFVVDVADTRISLATPFGPLGLALEGAGRLSGGFKGRLAAASPRLDPGRCLASGLRANVAVEVTARRPQVQGPVSLQRFNCPQSRFEIVQPRFDVNSRFNESFSEFDGRGRMAIRNLTAGENGLAAFAGDLSFRGSPTDVHGAVSLSAQQSRLATIFAERTRMAGRYRLGIARGTMTLVGNYAAQGSTLAPSVLAGMTEPLAAGAKTPVGPIATAIGAAITRSSREFDAAGSLRMVNFPGGGAVRVETANVRSRSGARVAVRGGDGITYYWPSNRIRVDGTVAMQGGGLPQGRIALRQPRSGAPMSGVAEFAPYAAGGSHLALAPVRFAAGRDGSTQVSTAALLDGRFPQGRVQGLRVPIAGRLGRGGSLAFGTACAVVQFDFFQMSGLQLGRTRLPVCPVSGAILTKPAGGDLRVGAQISRTQLSGRLGQSPLLLGFGNARFTGRQFALNDSALRLGRPQSPIIFNAGQLAGTFAGSGISGTFAGANSTVGNVPLAMTDMSGKWRFYAGDLTADAAMTVSDRSPEPRFYPLRTDNVRFSLADGFVRGAGTLRHPASGTAVSQVQIEHRLANGRGFALLDVPGITFGQGLQPEELTRLTEGVIALVQGTVTGQGRIRWNGDGEVSSTGEFSTAGMDLAAPFGPVTGLTTTIRFSDLLGLRTEPGQVATVAAINPGILVENGTIRYSLLSDQRVRVERGEWPFMGGRLILRETILNFARPTAKRLTFEVVGLDAKTFVDTFGFREIAATGTFDGVLPMIFDENGGRIVGGRLDARDPGGTLSYVGTINRASLNLPARLAFDALKDLRFRSMIVRLDGDLAGEFSTRITINQLGLSGSSGAAGLVRRAFAKVPFRFNINISGPFRALIATAKSFRDPRQQIGDVLPRPLDSVPGIVTEVRRTDEQKTQTQTPVEQQIEVTPPAATER